MGTTPHGLPYPEPSDAVAAGAAAIQALAEALDPRMVMAGSAGTNPPTNPPAGAQLRVAAGSVVAEVSASYHVTVTMAAAGFPNGLLAAVCTNGDYSVAKFYCNMNNAISDRSTLYVNPVGQSGDIPPGSMVRINYIAVGW